MSKRSPRTMHRWLASCGAVGLLTSASPALAQFNYRPVPMGGQSALMGGTGVVLARDGAGPYLNPATIERVYDTTLTLAVNLYRYGYTYLSNWHTPGPVNSQVFGPVAVQDNGAESSSFNGLPSTFCLYFALGRGGEVRAVDPGKDPPPTRHPSDRSARPEQAPTQRGQRRIAVCIGAPEREDLGFVSLQNTSDGGGFYSRQGQTLRRAWQRFQFGPSFAFPIGDRLALGASLHGVYAQYELAWAVDAITLAGNTPVSSTFTTTRAGQSFDATALLGLTYRVDSRWTIGASVQTPSLHFAGKYETTSFQQTAGTVQSTRSYGAKGSFQAPVPLRLALGAGYETERLRWEFDAFAYLHVGPSLEAQVNAEEISVNGTTSRTSQPATLEAKVDPVVNVATGLEYFFDRHTSLLLGVSTDLNAAKRLAQSPVSNDLTNVITNRVMPTFGLGLYGPGRGLLVGFETSIAWGSISAVNPYQSPPTFDSVRHLGFGALLVLAGSTNVDVLRDAVDRVVGRSGAP